MELQNVLLKYSMAVAGTSSLLYLLGFHTWLLPTLCLTVFVCASILVGSYLPRGGATHGYHSNLHPEMGALCQRLATPLFHALFHLCGYRAAASGFAAKKREELRRRVDAGETVYLVGINSGVHNAGIALVEVSKARGIQLLYNFEEERYSGDKHDTGYPRHSMHELCKILTKKGIELDKVVAFVSGWDHIESAKILIRTGVETFPLGIWNFFPSRYKNVTFFFNFGPLMNTSFLLHQQLTSYFSQSKSGNKDEKKKKNEQKEIEEEDEERKKATMPTKAGWKQWPIISSRHHDNHAYFSFLVSPFADSREPVMIVVMDGQGDDASVSFYVSEWSQKQQRNSIRCQYINHTTIDSLGLLYALISSTQGGWTALSSEGRYMGASAFGNMCRLTNPYYKRLRQIVFLRDNGEILLNRAFTNWQYDMNRPYTQLLKDILGEPIPHEKLWNPDAILNVNDIKHAAITRDRVDKASALQLVFEDCVFHVIEHMIRSTKGASTKLVWTGGTALNCLASMRLVDAFDESYYDRYYPQQEIEEIGTAKGKGKDKGKGKGKKEAEEKKTESRRLHIWVPPVPGDAGVAAGAAFRFAATCGANFSSSGLSSRLQHAFYCGTAPTASSILAALERHKKEVAFQQLGSIKKLKSTKKTNKKGQDEDEVEEDEKVVKAVADLMAFIVSKDGIVGIYQGSAETGPRALGHRTILANPVNAMTQENLNKHVKYRERVRPLAPMVTLEAAKELFHLSEGANNDDDYNAYNWMVLTTMVKEEARSRIPAVVHADGTSRLQIVRKETDRLCWEYLKAMGQRVGVEVSVNTSLNVGTPIVQTPEQVVDCLKRSKGMHAIFMVSEEGRVFVVWDKEEVEASAGLKDGGKKLKGWMAEWKEESGFQF